MTLKRLLKYFVFIAVFHLHTMVYAQLPAYSKEETDRMEMTVAFYIIQLNSVEAISAKYSKLAVAAQEALREWNKEFYASIQNIDRELETIDSAGWNAKKVVMGNKYSRSDYSRIKENDARDYIFEVNNRAIGKMEPPVLQTLLVFNPKYQKQPDREFTERYVKDFFSRDTKSSLGLDMKLVYPQSWVAAAGDTKTGVVQELRSRGGLGNITLSIYIERLTKAEGKDKMPHSLLQENMIKKMIRTEDVLEYKPDTYIDNCKAARVFAFGKGPLPAGNNPADLELYAMVYRDYLIKFLFQVTAPSGVKEDILAEYEKNKILIRKIKDNVVILSQWQ